MDILYNPIFLDHDTGEHPENRKRLEAFGAIQSTNIQDGSKYLTLVHTPVYIQYVKDACENGSHLDADTPTSQRSFDAATHAVGATVLSSEKGAFALVRPPGHHAHPTRAGGFCIFNNIAIAVQKLVNDGKKVLIFDFDGHLGDGTDEYFYHSDTVMYISFHQDQVFPGGGALELIGDGKGKGYTIHFPFHAGSGDDVYLHVLDSILPVVSQFAPDIIGFSAGFDGYHGDTLLRLRLSMGCYFQIGKRFSSFSCNKFAVLEGGYNTEALPKCVKNFIAGIDGKCEIPYADAATDTHFLELESVNEKLKNLKELLSPYWKL